MKIAAYVEPTDIHTKTDGEKKMFSAGDQCQPSLKAQTTLKLRLLLSPLFAVRCEIVLKENSSLLDDDKEFFRKLAGAAIRRQLDLSS